MPRSFLSEVGSGCSRENGLDRPISPDNMSRMIGSLESLSGLVAFVRTAEAGGFAAAGRRLGISASAVGKSVARLEERLGVRLLSRTTRAMTLTDEGALLYERASRILEDVAEAESTVAGTRDAPRGRLRVSLPTAFGQFVVVPRLPEFLHAHPHLELEVHLDDRQVDVIEEGYDLVVRIAQGLDNSGLIARQLGAHRFVICASPAYLARHGVPASPAALSDHHCIRFTLSGTGRTSPWRFVIDGREIAFEPPGRLAFNNNAAMLTAALADQGLAYLPAYVAEAALSYGSLIPVLDEQLRPNGVIAALFPPSRRTAPRVRVFVDFLSGLSQP